MIPSTEPRAESRPPLSGAFVHPAAVARADSGPLERRLECLLLRLERTPAGRAEELRVQALAAAVCAAGNGEELDANLARLRAAGLDTDRGAAFVALRDALPGWGLMPPPGADGASWGSLVSALLHLVALGGAEEHGAARFGETVGAAVERLNAGDFARGATLLGLAQLVARVPGVDWSRTEAIRARAHLVLSPVRLKTYAESPARRPLLRGVLEFFPGLMPHGLIAALEEEQSREGRRLLVLLLEVHGADGRAAAFARLREALAEPRGLSDWFLLRNLLTVLRRIPSPAATPSDAEIDALCRLSDPSLPAPLVKEAFTNLGQLRGSRAEQALATRLGQLESLLEKGGIPKHAAAESHQLLDHVTAALVSQRTLSAFRTVVEHALGGSSLLGDPLARLAPLSACDLSRDRALTERLEKALRSALPVKLLGFVSAAAEAASQKLVTALSGTTSSSVRHLLGDVAQRYEGQELGRAAARALRGLDAPRKPAELPGQGSASGPLEPLGLPSLLSTFERGAATGILSLRGASGTEVALLTLERGRLFGCTAGARRGTDAAYQLFERPGARSFVFTRLPELRPEDRTLATPVDLVAVLLEGTRRHGELLRASAVVPDGARLRPTSVRPTRPGGEPDTNLLAALWAKAAGGATPLACEAAVLVDSARVRRTLAHWVEEGAFVLVTDEGAVARP